MRNSRSFTNKSRRKAYAGASKKAAEHCGVRWTARPGCTPNCAEHPWDKPKGRPTKPCPKCPPQKACPPNKPCPPQKPCPACPPQKDCPTCPPQKACPPQRPCPPQKPCPPQRPCPEAAPCPEYDCEDACATLHPVGSLAYLNCVQRHCNPGLTTTFRPNPTLPPPPTKPPGLIATFRPNPTTPDPDCIFECRERYDAGEIDYATFQQCLVDCCLAEKIADGYSVDMAKRLCESQPKPAPTPAPTCEQRCRGKYGVNTAGYFDCVRRECTLTSTFKVATPGEPYIP
jgi:hypothetical protein